MSDEPEMLPFREVNTCEQIVRLDSSLMDVEDGARIIEDLQVEEKCQWFKERAKTMRR